MERTDVTRVLAEVTDGDESAAARLMELVYPELRRLAGGLFRDQPAAVTLQPTALVHEAFVRLVDRDGLRFNDGDHFFAICAVAMRGILADHARQRMAAKRGGDRQRVTMADVPTPSDTGEIDVLVLDDALTRLAALSPRQARIVEYRFFAGMTVEQVARVLDVSRSTVEDDWRMARAWLKVQLRKAAG